MTLERRFASGKDDELLASFWCWGGGEDYWVEEVENHIRGWLLKHSEHTVLFSDDEQLVAVSGFSRRDVSIVLETIPAWHLDVVAVDLDRQGAGLANEVFIGTFHAMTEMDPGRRIVTARIHTRNLASRSAANKAGIHAFRPETDDFWEFVGTVSD